MYNRIHTQNTFSRTMDNAQKMGAYYTDLAHCKSIGEMFLFPEDKEVSVLEPSIGDGKAVLTVTGAEENPNVKIFGVEVNDKVALEDMENPLFEEILEADFLEGVRIKNNAFSFCFGNPPYITDDLAEDGPERMERQFLEKVTNYLTKTGLIAWVIPYGIFADNGHMRFLLNHYEILTVYKFRAEEYAKFHQVVIIARKKDSTFVLKDEVDAALVKYQFENLEELPEHPVERYEVGESDSKKITLFCKKEFDVNGAYETLMNIEENDSLSDLYSFMDKALTTDKYVVGDIGNPPIPLKKDSLYLMATSGAGSGLTGDEITRDLHLQRGVAEVIEESDLREDEKGNPVEVVTSRTKISMTVVQNNGRIDVLE